MDIYPFYNIIAISEGANLCLKNMLTNEFSFNCSGISVCCEDYCHKYEDKFNSFVKLPPDCLKYGYAEQGLLPLYNNLIKDNTKIVILIFTSGVNENYNYQHKLTEYLKSKGLDIYVICSLPFKFEGEKRRQRGIKQIELLKENIDSCLIIDSEIIWQKEKLNFNNCFERLDSKIHNILSKIIEILDDSNVTCDSSETVRQQIKDKINTIFLQSSHLAYILQEPQSKI